MRVALFPNLNKPGALEVSHQVIGLLRERGVELVAPREVHHQLGVGIYGEGSHPDVAITFGGDGTILRVVHEYPKLEVPILGINLGHLGFMAEVPRAEVPSAIETLCRGDFQVDRRLVIDVDGGRTFAVNDVVIHRSPSPALVELSVWVDGVWVNTFLADGLIIATPGGSTAYNLAAGGPIVVPGIESLVLTPICPHTISNRPILLPAQARIEVQVAGARSDVDVAIDGIPDRRMHPEGRLSLSMASRTFNLVALPERDYYKTLRTKLAWSGKLV